ncbi:hypothetical protein EVAR_57925_1 [Eumeta japonica]|uniref:Uncharacterized protein n=1 Tax=Eumeta variegata TaxID=151549 RepID=A0A4C1ZQA2_EUMVA|nr:hypothetical protein EVAR_57925_1 [Eumeta japonica]
MPATTRKLQAKSMSEYLNEKSPWDGTGHQVLQLAKIEIYQLSTWRSKLFGGGHRKRRGHRLVAEHPRTERNVQTLHPCVKLAVLRMFAFFESGDHN